MGSKERCIANLSITSQCHLEDHQEIKKILYNKTEKNSPKERYAKIMRDMAVQNATTVVGGQPSEARALHN